MRRWHVEPGCHAASSAQALSRKSLVSRLSRILKVGSLCAAARSFAQAESGLYASDPLHVFGKPDDNNSGKPGANDVSFALHPATISANAAPLLILATTSINLMFRPKIIPCC